MKSKFIIASILCLGLGLADLIYINLQVLPTLWAEPDAPVQKAVEQPEPSQTGSESKAKEMAALSRPESQVGALEPVASDPGAIEEKPAGPATVTNHTAETGPGVTNQTLITAPPADTKVQKIPEEPKVSEELIVYFSHGSGMLTHDHKQQLTSLLQDHDFTEPFTIEISGHTDRTGSSHFDNELLSMQRAEAVASFLIEQGVDTRHITTRGYGASRSLDPNNNPAAWAKNRRAEIRIYKGGP